MGKIAVAFITYNRPYELKRAIDSCICVNKSGVPLEILIWDNHSSSENKEKLESYIRDYSGLTNYSFKYFYSEENLGVAGGRNAVWTKCRGEYVFFLDDDAVVDTKDFFVKALDYMERDVQVGVLALNIQEPETNSNHNCAYRKKVSEYNEYTLCFAGGAHILRKEAWPYENLYPEKLFFGSEERYVSFLLWGKGYRIVFMDEWRIQHLPSQINRYDGKSRNLNLIVNHYVVKKLVYPISVQPFMYVFYMLHMIKNSLSLREGHKLIKERYCPSEVNRIGLSALVRLSKLFGWKGLL